MGSPWFILADDLTGAADSAIAFARRRVPSQVTWGDSLPLAHADAMVLAYDAATRELDAVSAARNQFERLGMTQTRERNAVLIFVAPRAQKFAVIGDRGVYEKCGQPFWEALTQAMRPHFHAQHFTDAIVHAVREAGSLLAQHFPRRPDDRNELPNAVEES